MHRRRKRLGRVAAGQAATGGATPLRSPRPRRELALRRGLALGSLLALGHLALLADELGLLLDLGLGLLLDARRRQRRDRHLVGIDALAESEGRRPRAAPRALSWSVSPMDMPETSAGMLSGIAVGSASIVIWWVTCSSTPPSFTPGASSVPEQLDRDLRLDRLVELHLEQVEVEQPATDGIALLLLDDHGGRARSRRT